MKKEEKLLKNWFLNFRQLDSFFIQLTIALIIVGLIFSYSSSVYESYRLTNNYWTMGFKQTMALAMGLVALFLLSKIDYKFWFKYTALIGIIMFVIMLITVFTPIGKSSGGSQRWIEILGFQFQPAEIAKFSVILLVSKLLTKYKWNQLKKTIYYFTLISGLILIILKQPDLGSASILVLATFQLLFIFEWPIWILCSLIPTAFFAVYLKLKATPYQLERITFWLNPHLDPEGKGYNLIQSKYAFGLGGLFGAGLGNSVQKHGYLPVAHSDFIFSVIGEEIGFLGLSAVLVLYITWIARGIFLTTQVKNKFGRILSTGIILLIATQTVVNICVSIGLLPVTGVTLPFFSCGGTSLITTLAMCGVLFNILSESKSTQAEKD